jgi:hypothetical protein
MKRGVVLHGCSVRIANSQRETFGATAKVGGGTITSVPERLIWDIGLNPALESLNFDVEGTLTFRER